MIISRTSLRTVAALGAGLALTLASCGGGDDDAVTDPTTSSTPDTTTTAPSTPPSGPSSLTLSDQDGDGTTVTIDSVDLPADGFIAIHADAGGSPGPVIGVSDLLPSGASSDVTVQLDEPLTATGTVFPMVHLDTDSNGIYEFGSVDGVDGPGVDASGAVAVGPVMIMIAGTEASEESTGGSGDAAPAPGDNTITIADFAFSGVTEVPVGTTVVVRNDDGVSHTWTAEDGTFDSGSIGSGDTFEFTFTEPGEFAYFCNFHPSMTGTITVTG